MAAGRSKSTLADNHASRDRRRQRHRPARIDPRVSFHLTLPGLCRIADERECQPPRGDGTGQQEHRRTAGAASRNIPPAAPERHRRGALRCRLRLRGPGRRRSASTVERMKMKIDAKDFRVREGDEVDLSKWPTKVKPVYDSRKQYHTLLEDHVARLSAQQQLLYASDRHAVLLIFQAMDAAGKDGAIKHVMSGVNPQGCQVFSFKHPNPTELQHDFLWRTTRALPERGRIGIFNRSYYEEVLILRVHPEILEAERLPPGPRGE